MPGPASTSWATSSPQALDVLLECSLLMGLGWELLPEELCWLREQTASLPWGRHPPSSCSWAELPLPQPGASPTLTHSQLLCTPA